MCPQPCTAGCLLALLTFADPNLCGLPWGEAVVPSASSLPLRQQHHPWSNVVRDQGASCRTIFAILLLEGQAVLLSSCPRRCPGQKIEVLWEVSKPESHPPSVPGGWGSGCGLGRISGLQCQPAPLQLHLGWEGKSPQCSRQEGGCANL